MTFLQGRTNDINKIVENAIRANFRLSYYFLYDTFKEYLEKRLEMEFKYLLTSKKLKEPTLLAKEYLLEEAVYEFFESKDGKLLIEQYEKIKEEEYFDLEIYKKMIPIFFSVWTGVYLKPIRIILILFIPDKDLIYKEFKKIGMERKNKRKGRSGKYEKYFINMALTQNYLEEKLGGRKRGKSDDTTAIRHVCKKLGLHFKHSIVTSFNNWKLKHKAEYPFV